MIRPSYWTDADLHTRLTAEQREFYIGLWMLADDAGIVDFDVDRIGAELYPYRPHRWRTSHIPRWIECLGGHVQIMDCGRHLIIPSLKKHQSPPRPSYPNQRAHDACLRQMAASATSTGVEGGGVGLKGFREGRRGATVETIEENPSEFRQRMAAASKVPA
jgi:hypothetical protein